MKNDVIYALHETHWPVFRWPGDVVMRSLKQKS